MDNLPSEIVVSIFENTNSLQDLLVLRRLARRYRDLADRFCADIAFRLGREHFYAFDKALLAVRLKSIPFASCCHYDEQRGAYSFVPSLDFLQAVMEGAPVPPNCPAIPRRPWIEDCAAVMDLYLLALAWRSTMPNDASDDHRPLGENIATYMRAVAPRLLDSYLHMFYRLCVFTSLFAPRVLAQPAPLMHDASTSEKTDYAVFDGFFDWFYALPEPGSAVARVSKGSTIELRPRTMTQGQWERMIIYQFVQVLRTLFVSGRVEELRSPDTIPNRELLVKPMFNPVYVPEGMEAKDIYRPDLNISPWSAPEAISKYWVESRIPLILVPSAERVGINEGHRPRHYFPMMLSDAAFQRPKRHTTGLERTVEIYMEDYGMFNPPSDENE